MKPNWQQIFKSALGLKTSVLIWVAVLFLANTVSLWHLDHPSGAVWSGDAERAGRLRTGQVVINGADLSLTAPFGGYKQSGNGRELGVYGFEEFLEYKALHL